MTSKAAANVAEKDLNLGRLRFLRQVGTTRFAAFAADLRHMLTIAAHGFAALAADHGHVLAVGADRFAALAARLRDVVLGGHARALPDDEPGSEFLADRLKMVERQLR